MANLVRRRRESELAPSSTSGGWDPFRSLRELARWDPFATLRFDPFAAVESMLPAAEQAMFVPDVEVRETSGAIEIRLDLPGVEEGEIDVSVWENRITISGRREHEERQEDERYHAYERSFGAFSRSFTLPDGCDANNVKAELQNGVLKVIVPKKASSQPRRIQLGKPQEEGQASSKGLMSKEAGTATSSGATTGAATTGGISGGRESFAGKEALSKEDEAKKKAA